MSIPPLTKDKRVQYVKLAKDYCEKTKARHRNFPFANAPGIWGVKRLGAWNPKIVQKLHAHSLSLCTVHPALPPLFRTELAGVVIDDEPA